MAIAADSGSAHGAQRFQQLTEEFEHGNRTIENRE
jgi:hypothetical protein